MNKSNPAGYNLVELSSTTWILEQADKEGGYYMASFSEIFLMAHLKLGIPLRELEKGLVDMARNNMDTVHFGMYGSFMYCLSSGQPKTYKSDIDELIMQRAN